MSSPRLTLPQVYLQPHQLPKIQPRYITDTPVTDKEEAKKHDSALQRAKFALGVLTKRRNKSRGSVAGTGEGNVPEENMKPPPPVPSMYDKEEWPKRHPNGGIQESWSAIGYPTNLDLVVEDIESLTHISRTPDIERLEKDLIAIQFQKAEDIADSVDEIWREEKSSRVIETFSRSAMSVVRVRMLDVRNHDPSKKEVSSKCAVRAVVEKAANEAVGTQPDLEVERHVTAQLLLDLGGHIGGTTADYWTKARDLAQQALHLQPDLETNVERQIRQNSEAAEVDEELEAKTETPSNKAFNKMLKLVNKALIQSKHNPYHQGKRNKWFAETTHDIVYRVANVDIIMVLDKFNNVNFFQCSNAFERLLPQLPHQRVFACFDTWSTLMPGRLPDMTRHGEHWIAHLHENPQLDFRLQEKDEPLRKSHLYHHGGRCQVGDVYGRKGVNLTKDSKAVVEWPHAEQQLLTLLFGAYGACTTVNGFFFGILDPMLYEEYRAMYENTYANLNPIMRLKLGTRRQGEYSCMRALLVNLATNEHKDTGDWYNGLAGLNPFGPFTDGADLILREFGLQIAAPAGSAQLIRSHEDPHSITKYSGKRICVVTTNHENVKRAAFLRMNRSTLRPEDAETDDCIDQNQEDWLPEDQVVRSDAELHPEVMDPYASDSGAENTVSDEEEKGSSEAEEEPTRPAKRRRMMSGEGGVGEDHSDPSQRSA